MIGLPGSGKSYLLNNLSMPHIQVINEEGFYDCCKKISRIKKIGLGLKTLVCYFDVILFLYLYSLFCCEKNKYAVARIGEVIKYISLYEYIIKMDWK